MLICDHWFHATFIWLSLSRERKIWEKSKNAVKRMFTLELLQLVCVCVCVCVLYLCVVVCVIVSVCVYNDACATWHILDCLMNMYVMMCSGSHGTVVDLVEKEIFKNPYFIINQLFKFLFAFQLSVNSITI